jgi:hypothetical protein
LQLVTLEQLMQMQPRQVEDVGVEEKERREGTREQGFFGLLLLVVLVGRLESQPKLNWVEYVLGNVNRNAKEEYGTIHSNNSVKSLKGFRIGDGMVRHFYMLDA